MITQLHGILLEKSDSFLTLDVHGVGFLIHTSSRSLAQAQPLDSPLTVHTTLIVREDALQLVGFITREEREVFELLNSASGVGFKGALSLMSSLSVSEVAMAIMGGDHKRLTAAKGIGPKLAQKITIELKDKVAKWQENRMDKATWSQLETLSEKSPAAREAEEVLVSLGYTFEEIHQALSHLHTETNTEALLAQALKWIATQSVT